MTAPCAEILSQGDEVVTGQIADTNAAWLSERLTGLGFAVKRHTTVGDDLENLADAFREIAERADLCICTGGLGPTVDDLTAEAVSLASARPLQEDPDALRQIRIWFAGRAEPMPEVNRKQALLPEGAQRLDNLRGTAPGFALNHAGCRICCLPGVPHEMKFMFDNAVEPDLCARFPTQPEQLITLRVLGVGESTLQQRLNSIALPQEIKLGFRTVPPENHVKLTFPAHYPAAKRDAVTEEIRRMLGPSVFGIDTPENSDGTLIECVDRLMRQADASLATLETLSRGHLAQLCGALPWWLSGLALADSERIQARLGPYFKADSTDPLANAGAVAEYLRQQEGSTHALVCIDSRHTPDILYLAVAAGADTITERHPLEGNPRYRHALAAAKALDLLRRAL
ncbi:MAG: molybdopterin-binding protein [Methylococcus sp.]|nr:molybdopterin-binding protein [Methylococcus sp.]